VPERAVSRGRAPTPVQLQTDVNNNNTRTCIVVSHPGSQRLAPKPAAVCTFADGFREFRCLSKEAVFHPRADLVAARPLCLLAFGECSERAGQVDHSRIPRN